MCGVCQYSSTLNGGTNCNTNSDCPIGYDCDPISCINNYCGVCTWDSDTDDDYNFNM